METNLELCLLQAAIAAVQDEATRAEDTDWPQILALYDLLKRMSDNPIVMLNHAIAAVMVHGPSAGLDLLNATVLAGTAQNTLLYSYNTCPPDQ